MFSGSSGDLERGGDMLHILVMKYNIFRVWRGSLPVVEWLEDLTTRYAILGELY